MYFILFYYFSLFSNKFVCQKSKIALNLILIVQISTPILVIFFAKGGKTQQTLGPDPIRNCNPGFYGSQFRPFKSVLIRIRIQVQIKLEKLGKAKTLTAF